MLEYQNHEQGRRRTCEFDHIWFAVLPGVVDDSFRIRLEDIIHELVPEGFPDLEKDTESQWSATIMRSRIDAESLRQEMSTED